MIVFFNEYKGRTFSLGFLAFGAYMHSFIHYIYPVIDIDATHWFEKYHGVLMMVTIIDGSNKLFSVVFWVVEIVGKELWEWFLFELGKCFGGHYDYLSSVNDRGILTVSERNILRDISRLPHGSSFEESSNVCDR